MKMLLLFIVMMCLPMVAQTKGVRTDSYRTVWYDSLYNTQKIRTVNLEMKYLNISVVVVNKSTTITDSIKISSVTEGYKTTRPFNAVDFAVSGIWLKNDLGKDISSESVIALAPGTSKEFIVGNFTIQFLEFQLLNADANAKVFFYIRGVKQSQDRE